ncbi:MAG: clostripain-related cysteine peptidase [Elusimicrobia bacterium]|nr:clostripain-related cysteine peptidase [Elusimicrobiota bacterium]
MRKVFAAAALLAFIPGLAPFSRALEFNFAGVSYKSAPAAVSAPDMVNTKSAAPKVKEWTIMVFLNGKNNLELAGLYNVNKMEKVGSDANINVVVELGRMNGQAAGDTNMDGNWTGSRRLYIKKDKNDMVVTSPIVQKAPVVDMGDYKRVVSFVKWAKESYPARKYMLVLWDHGSGWMDLRARQEPKAERKGISFDDETGNFIRTRQIGDILKEAGRVDVLAYDACLMQMAEVAFEVKDNASVIVGSEETVPGTGYPYDLILGVLAQKPALSAEDMGILTVEAYKAFYEAMKKGTQLSAIRAAKLGDLGTKLAEFSALAREVNDAGALRAARAGVIRYDMLGVELDPKMSISFYGDLHQYAGLMAAGLKSNDGKAAALRQKAAALQQFIDKELVIDNKATGNNRLGRPMAESRGISVYLPPAETRVAQAKLEGLFEGKYGEFRFDKDVHWHDYVTYLYGVK